MDSIRRRQLNCIGVCLILLKKSLNNPFDIVNLSRTPTFFTFQNLSAAKGAECICDKDHFGPDCSGVCAILSFLMKSSQRDVGNFETLSVQFAMRLRSLLCCRSAMNGGRNLICSPALHQRDLKG